MQQQLDNFSQLSVKQRERQLQYLNRDVEWAQACADLVSSKAWATLKDKVEQQRLEVADSLVNEAVKPESMPVVAARMKSRVDFLAEIEQMAKLAEAKKLRLEAMLKLHHRP